MIKNTNDLYKKMLNTPNLAGKFELVGETLFWDLFDGFSVEIAITENDTFLSIASPREELIHWHPYAEDVYGEVCRMGSKGNVTLIRKNFFSVSLLYMGKEENCPYSPFKKRAFGRLYYLKAK